MIIPKKLRQKKYTSHTLALCRCEKIIHGFGPAQENLSWRNLCIFKIKPTFFLDNLAGHSVTQDLRSHCLRWLWNAPDAQRDSLDKAAEGEMQKEVPLIGMDKKSPSDGQLPGRASLRCFCLSTPVEKRLIPVESYLRSKLMVTGEPLCSNPIRLIPPAPHLRLKFH